MKKIATRSIQYQKSFFYLFLLLLLICAAAAPALATSPISDPYENIVGEALAALDKGDTRSAYVSFQKARKLARKNDDQAAQDAFQDCLKKVVLYENYLPNIIEGDTLLNRKDYKNAQLRFLAAKAIIEQSTAMETEWPTVARYEKNKLEALNQRIAEIEKERIVLLEEALKTGDEKLLQNLPGDALAQYQIAREMSLDQNGENQDYRIGERIQKAEYYYDVYVQLNLGRREAGYKRYREAESIFTDALTKVEHSRERYFPQFEAYDLQRQNEIQALIGEISEKRAKNYEWAIDRGREYLEKDQPEEALKAFAYAKKHMFEDKNEYESSGVKSLINKAEYGLLLKEGAEYHRQAKYREALASFQQAAAIENSLEVADKIRQTKEAGYRSGLTRGRAAFANGDYERAKALYDEAASFKDGPELQNQLALNYQELLARGNREMENAAYAQAKSDYKNASLFSDTEEVRELIGQVQGGSDYAAALETGEIHLQEGNVTAAKESFEQAAAYRRSPEVEKHLRTIEDYQRHFKAGQEAFETGDPERALSYFQNAQFLINTGEVDDWISHANNRIDNDRMAVQTYQARSIYARPATGVAAFNYTTYMWIRPDCKRDWYVELYDVNQGLVGSEKLDAQCKCEFTNLPDGDYTYVLKLQEGSAINGKAYATADNRVKIQNGKTERVEIKATGEK